MTAAAAGAVLGSYVTTAALRSVRGEQSAVGRSRCDGCGLTLGWFETAPVVSFVIRGGACRACGGEIDRAHLVGEIVGALGGLLLVQTGFSFYALLAGLLGLVLLAASVIDAKTLRLPDILTAIAGCLCVLLACLNGRDALWIGLAAGLTSYGVLAAVRLASRTASNAPGLGLGDVKLVAVLAIWLGIYTPWAVVIAAVLGLAFSAVTRPRDGRIAFGPMIAVASWSIGVVGGIGWLPTLT